MNGVASADADIHKAILEASTDALGLAMLICDRNDEILFASKPILQIFPIAPDVIAPGRRLRDFLGAIFDTGIRLGSVPETSRRRANRDDWISEKISLHWREHYDTIERVSRQRWISVSKRRLPSGIGILAITDVSDQKRRDETIQTDMERIDLTEQILDTLSNPICVKDRNLNFVAVNKAFCAVHGVAAEAVLGRSVWDMLDADLAERCERSDRQVLENGVTVSIPEQIVTADGSDLWSLTSKYRVGQPGKHLIVTCMNDVTGIAVPVGPSAVDEPGQPHLRIEDYELFEPAQNCYDPFRMLDVKHLFEASTIMSPAREQILRVVLHTARPDVEARLLGCLRDWGVEACAITSLDEQLAFDEIAIQHGVEVDLLLVDQSAPDSAEAAFAWSRSRVLQIAPDIEPEMLHLQITDLAAFEAGSVVGLPAAMPSSFEVTTGEPPAAARIDVLVAEDNELNQFVFSQILDSLGLSYRIASNGLEAVALWRELQPDLVLMDLSMPMLNGLQATQQIREAELTLGTRTPIIAVTTLALDIDTADCRSAGMDDAIIKPVSPDMIEAIYKTFVEQPRSRDAG